MTKQLRHNVDLTGDMVVKLGDVEVKLGNVIVGLKMWWSS